MILDPKTRRDDGPEPRIAIIDAGVAFAAPIAALHEACFPDDFWSEHAFAVLLADATNFARIAVAEPVDGGMAGQPVGIMLARIAADQCEILTFGVVPTARRRGIGRRLIDDLRMQAARRGGRSIFLEVAEDNIAAALLYDRAGFTMIGRRPGYYQRPTGPMAARALELVLDPGAAANLDCHVRINTDDAEH